MMSVALRQATKIIQDLADLKDGKANGQYGEFHFAQVIKEIDEMDGAGDGVLLADNIYKYAEQEMDNHSNPMMWSDMTRPWANQSAYLEGAYMGVALDAVDFVKTHAGQTFLTTDIKTPQHH